MAAGSATWSPERLPFWYLLIKNSNLKEDILLGASAMGLTVSAIYSVWAAGRNLFGLHLPN